MLKTHSACYGYPICNNVHYIYTGCSIYDRHFRTDGTTVHTYCIIMLGNNHVKNTLLRENNALEYIRLPHTSGHKLINKP